MKDGGVAPVMTAPADGCKLDQTDRTQPESRGGERMSACLAFATCASRRLRGHRAGAAQKTVATTSLDRQKANAGRQSRSALSDRLAAHPNTDRIN